MKKTFMLCLALVLALGALGAGYAAWTDQITITGSVSTGDVCLCITETGLGAPFASDYCGSGHLDNNGLYSSCSAEGVPNISTQEPAELKDVACTDVTWVDCNTLAVTVTNAYPYYAAAVDFELCNCGSVPVKLWKVTISDDNGNSKDFYDDPAEICLDIDNDGEYDMIIDWGNSWGDQREYGECYDLSFGFVFLQPLDPDQQNLKFYITTTAIQFDEYTPGPLGTQ